MSQTLKKKENRRVRYTRLALRESLLAQMEKQPLNKITVTRVCETADVNRSTVTVAKAPTTGASNHIEAPASPAWVRAGSRKLMAPPARAT